MKRSSSRMERYPAETCFFRWLGHGGTESLDLGTPQRNRLLMAFFCLLADNAFALPPRFVRKLGQDRRRG